jgi:hypothetical protein
VLQRFLHIVRAHYAWGVFWAYLAAVGVAFLSIFVFPPAALGLVLAGALMLPVAVLGGALLRAVDRVASRPYWKSGVCPHCRAEGQEFPGASQTCSQCGAQFSPDGEWQPS